MFHSIKYLRYEKEKIQYIYEIVDSDFTCEVTTDVNFSLAYVDIAAAVIQEYSRRSLNVPKNLALYYLFAQRYDPIHFIGSQIYFLDKYYSELKFREKYYNCTLNQIKQLNFGKRDALRSL